MYNGNALNIVILCALLWIASASSVLFASSFEKDDKKSPYYQLGLKLLQNKVHSGLAVHFLSQAVISDPNDLQAKYYLAKAYKANGDYLEAKKWFFKLYKLSSDQFPDVKYEYASLLAKEGKVDEAKSLLEAYDEVYPSYKKLKQDISSYSSSDLFYKLLYSGSKQIRYEGYLNYLGSPALLKMSLTKGPWKLGLSKKLKDEKTESIMDSFYMPSLILLEEFLEIPLPKIPDSWFWCGLPSFNKAGNVMYVSLYSLNIDKGREYSIFKANKDKDGAWSELKKLGKPVNDGESSSRFPHFYESDDGEKALFYCSDKKDGLGGYDLYYSLMNKSGDPEIVYNLGSEVNSTGNDISPFIHTNTNALYFSTDGRNDIGHLDLFKAHGNLLEGFNNSIGLGREFNSMADEWSCYVGSDTSELIILSNFKGQFPFGSRAVYKCSGQVDIAIPNNLGNGEEIEQVEVDKNENEEEEKEVIQIVNEVDTDSEEEILIDEEGGLRTPTIGDGLEDFLSDPSDTIVNVNAEFHLKIRMFDKLTKRPITGGVVVFTKSKGDESIRKNGPGKQYIIKGEQEIIFLIKKENYEDHKFRVSTFDKVDNERIISDVYLRHKLNEDEKAYENLLENCGNLEKEELVYRVQIGAFRSRKMTYFNSLNLGYRILEQYTQGLYKYLVYNAPTPYEIDNVRQDVVNQGISDAFVVPYYKRKRISVKKALDILIPN